MTQHGATWLHLADVHLAAHPRRSPEWAALRADLVRDLTERHDRHGTRGPDFIVVTGDIARGGTARVGREYATAQAFLTTISQITGVPRERCYCVPGNHDIRRGVGQQDPTTRQWLAGLRDGTASIDGALVDSAGLSRLRARLIPYLRFAKDHGTAGTTRHFGGLCWSAQFRHGGLRIGLAGVNSVLLSADDQEERRLQVGLAQLERVLAGLDDCDLLVLLTHHPLSWLRDGDLVAARLAGRPHVHLHGHRHVRPATSTPLVSVASGAGFEPTAAGWRPTGEFRYTMVTADLAGDELRLTTRARSWSGSGGFGPDPRRTRPGGESIAPRVPRQDPLARLSADLMGQFGRRRTAYPLDMSLAELHRLGLFVPSRLTRYHEHNSELGERAVGAVVATLRRGESVLLLGQPGAGKSLTLYGAALELRRSGKLPVPVRALDVGALRIRVENIGLTPERWTDAVLLIDGLDEAAEVVTSGSLVEYLQTLPPAVPVLVTSRTREYEDLAAFETASISFDQVFVINGWDVDVEFADYLARLKSHGLVDDPYLYRTVVTSRQLARMVSRPLYARMLTFVGQAAATRVADPTSLYSEYLTRLARATDFAVRAAYPGWSGRSAAVWQDVAWHVYVHERPADAMPMAELDATLRTHGEPAPAIRALNQILDRRTLHGTEVGEFIHYSFFEHLLARHIRDRMLTDLTAAAAIEMFRLDLTREVRHHLAGQLRELADDRLGTRLRAMYRHVREAPDVDHADRLTVCNLLVYLISRVSPTAPHELGALLRAETDGFLLSSILWAQCHLASDAALRRFYRLLQEKPDFRAVSRGYVLYYYGDFRAGGPPFLDLPPHISHERTTTRVLAMFDDPTFRSVAPQRRFVDLYTFIEIYLVRQLKVSHPALAILRTAIGTLSGSDVPHRMMDRLRGMLGEISPAAVSDDEPGSFVDGKPTAIDDPAEDGS